MPFDSFLKREPYGRPGRIQPMAHSSGRAGGSPVHRRDLRLQRFNEPLTRVVGITHSITGRDWTIPEVGWTYSIALIMLGLSAATLGRWVERAGPRKTIVASAFCFCGGLWLSSLGVSLHQHLVGLLWLRCDRRHWARSRLHCAGVDAGQMVPRPAGNGDRTGHHGLRRRCLDRCPARRRADGRFVGTSVGVKEAFLVMGCALLCLHDVRRVQLPRAAPGWLPEGYVPPATPKKLVTHAHVSVDLAWKTPQFWLLWVVLCLNVTAGIGVLGQASLMCQDMFGVSAVVGGGFAGLLSIFNMAGRLFWSSMSDLTGRKAIYCVFFLLGAVLYALVPVAQQYHSVLCSCS